MDHEHKWRRAYIRGSKREWLKNGWACLCGATTKEPKELKA